MESAAAKCWQHTTLGSVIELNYGKPLPAKVRDGVMFPVFGSNGEVGKHSFPLVEKPGLIIGRKGSFGEVHISKEPFFLLTLLIMLIVSMGNPYVIGFISFAIYL